jgi:SIR2-like domain
VRWRNRKWLVERLSEAVPAPSPGSPAFLGLGPHDAETLANWAEAAHERGAVLFVGAGWTRNAIPAPRLYEGQEDQPLPLLWSELAEKLREGIDHDVGKEASLDPLWLAELYRQRYGEDALHTLLRQAVPDDRLQPGPLHEALTVIRWRAILTTNYDTLLKRSFEPVRRVRVCVDDVDLVRSAARDAVELVHLHGVVDRPTTIVLALEDYRRYPEKHPGLLAKVRQLFLQHPVLFVGFGVTDPNFLQWSGWLADVVGKVQNPWVSLTLDPPPSLSHGRYWGARLNFVSVQPFPRFREVVPRVFRSLGEMLDEERRSADVAALRLQITKRPAATVREVQDLLETGAKRGAEGHDWGRFRIWLFNAAASRVLDIAEIEWRDSPPGQKNERVTILVDARPPAHRERNAELLAQLRHAFGDSWKEWCRIVQSHVGNVWIFQRVDLAKRRPSDPYNTSPVPVGGDGSDKTSRETTDGPAAPRTGDPDLDTLWAGGTPSTPGIARTAQDHRRLGYLACQGGHWTSAARHYGAAARASRTEYEALRREWLTLLSQQDCLQNATFREQGEDHELLKAELLRLSGTIKQVREALAALPLEDGETPLIENEIETERKVAAQLVEDLDRDDVDNTTRLGQIYGSAEEWLDRLEHLWLAPSLIAPAAEALGILQWRYGDWVGAANTLARYGSSRLKKIASAIASSGEARPDKLQPLIDELLRDGRWPGEWLARAEAMVPLAAACSEEQLERLGTFVNRAWKAFADGRGAARGGSVQRVWSALASIDRLAATRWPLLSAQGAVQAIDEWLAERGGASAHPVTRAPSIQALSRLPWKRWTNAQQIESSWISEFLVRLGASRLSAERSADAHDDLEATLDLIIDLAEQQVVWVTPGTPLRTRTGELLIKLAGDRAKAFEARLARLDGDTVRLNELVNIAIGTIDANKKPPLNVTAIDTIAVAPDVALLHGERLEGALRAATEEIANRLKKGHHISTWGVVDDARAIGFLLGRLLGGDGAGDERFVSQALALVQLVPAAAEYLTACAPKIPTLKTAVADATTDLLRGAFPDLPLSRRQQQYVGLRGVTRALADAGIHALSSTWLAGVAALSGASDVDLAAYATWILSEWATRRQVGEADQLVELTVGPSLCSAASDRRAAVRAPAARGLVALVRTVAPPGRAETNARLIGQLTSDSAVAVRRAVDGSGSLQP